MGGGPLVPAVYKVKVVSNQDGIVEFYGHEATLRLKPPEDDLSYFPVGHKFLVRFDPSAHED